MYDTHKLGLYINRLLAAVMITISHPASSYGRWVGGSRTEGPIRKTPSNVTGDEYSPP